MTDNSRLCWARFKSRASAVNKGFWKRILGHVLSFLSILLSISLYLPPPIFHSFSIRSSSSPGIANTSAGGRITDKSPGVLDSATLAGARHILACRTSCHIGLKNKPHKAAQFKHNTEEPAGPPGTVFTQPRLQPQHLWPVVVIPVTQCVQDCCIPSAHSFSLCVSISFSQKNEDKHTGFWLYIWVHINKKEPH